MKKPMCKLIGTNGNVFAIIGKVSQTLKNVGLTGKAEEFSNKALDCKSYDNVLQLCHEYVEIY